MNLLYRYAATRVLLPLLLFVLFGAGIARSQEATVRDSAGIRIVENRAPAWEPGQGWTVSDTPVVDIGVRFGAPPYQLADANSAVRLPDGRIVVANGGTNELRFYNAEGEHLRTVGGTGGGPSEFEDLGGVRAYAGGDTLVAWDVTRHRFVVFDAEGNFVRGVRAEAIGGFVPQMWGLFADGSAVLTDGFHPGAVYAAGTGPWRRPMVYLHYSPSRGALLDTLASFPGDERYAKLRGSGGFSIRDIPFGREIFVAVEGNRFYVGRSGSYEVAVYTPEGELVMLIRKRHEPRRVTDENVERYTEKTLAARVEEGDKEDLRWEEQILSEMPVPETMPAFGGLAVDADGNVWVRSFRPWWKEGPTTWSVFNATGRLLGTVELPAGLEVLQIGPDFVLGWWQDRFGVDHIRVYALGK